ncbi:hypothetical protein [Nonomuraea sp. B19D2]|uniref:hypothetical protein n=1 Tax=Nonomuraea sp. B19D2 TaxID=3159561 RepID=UPI0032D9D489
MFTAYALAFGGPPLAGRLAGGRAGELFGRRRLFIRDGLRARRLHPATRTGDRSVQGSCPHRSLSMASPSPTPEHVNNKDQPLG